MQDGFGRKITYLRISVTDRCNFRCRYCMPIDGIAKQLHSDMCSFEALRDMAAACVSCGVQKIRVTGGEPLVRRGIVDFCRMLKEIPGVQELCLTTNGSLLPEYAKPLREAGVDRLNISLDTLKPERFEAITRGGSLQEVLDGIEAAENAGFSDLKINCVLLGGYNDDEIPDFVALTREKSWQVRFIELMPMGECAMWDNHSFISAKKVLTACPELQKADSDGVADLYRLPGAKGTVGLITPMSHKFCADCSRIRLTADGKLKPCLHSDTEISLRGLEGQTLIEAIQEGIAKKPKAHTMQEFGQSSAGRSMNEIGG